jgi:hypothetical protein
MTTTKQKKTYNPSNRIFVFDLVWSCAVVTFERVLEVFKEFCKRWVFQQEKGEVNDFLHWQCRVSMKQKITFKQACEIFERANVKVTSTNNRGNVFYVIKAHTRVAGPWKDNDSYVPRQIRELTSLYPWQQYVLWSASVWDKRTINVILDTRGVFFLFIFFRFLFF